MKLLWIAVGKLEENIRKTNVPLVVIQASGVHVNDIRGDGVEERPIVRAECTDSEINDGHVVSKL